MSKDKARELIAEFDKYFTSSNGVDVPARVSVPRDEWRIVRDSINAIIEGRNPSLDAIIKHINTSPRFDLANASKSVTDAVEKRK